MTGARTTIFAGSRSHASVGMRRAELALMAMIVALFVLTVGEGAKLVLGEMGVGQAAPMDIVQEGDASVEVDDD